MEAHVPRIFSTPHKKTWFDHAGFDAVKDREAAYKMYLSLRAHAIYDLRNRTKPVL